MSVISGPNTIKEGLIFSLDAANPASYPGSGTTWYDTSGNGFHAEFTNLASYSNGVFSFDGVDDYATVNGNVRTVIEASLQSTVTALVNIKYIEHVDNLIGWGNANSDGGGFSRTWGIYANGGTLRTAYSGGSIFGNLTDLGNKWIYMVGRYDNDVTYSDIFGEYQSSTTATLPSTSTWKGISTSYPVTIGKTSYYTRWMEVDVSLIQVYDTFLSNEQVKQNYHALRGRFGLT